MFNKDFKNTRIHYAIYILGAIGALAIVVLFLHVEFARQTQQVQKEAKGLTAPVISDNLQFNRALIAGATTISISIANTDATRQQGLSSTASLPANSGKLFVFDTPGNYGFWMKDMEYPLDFVWIDSSMKIVGITPNVAANTYPQIFYPPSPVQEVLEVNANFSTEHRLSVGQQLTLQKDFD